MAKGLENQVYIYSLGTYSFFTDEENKLFRRYQTLKGYKKYLRNLKDNLKNDASLSKKEIRSKKKDINAEIKRVINGSEVEKGMDELKVELYKMIDNYNGIRTLRVEELKRSNVISVFDSVLTRTLNLEIDEISEDIIVIQSYHEKVLENLIKDGFLNQAGQKYIYLSSSAGMIRQKRGVWIKESLWTKHQDSLTCGLSVGEINRKGGMNINKFLSYKSLIFSASEEFEGFNIRNCIVVDDLELEVESNVDYINRDTYEIAENVKKPVPITATDGCGMILPSVSEKNFMVRLPYVKGLLASYDFTKHGRYITDIDGEVRDVIAENIKIIFTKSQWKMHAYFDSWKDYQSRFEMYNCKAAKLNEEEDELNDGKISYQMLQSLTDVTDDELKEIAVPTSHDILSLGESQETMLKVLGATTSNSRKGSLQKALMMYPELLNDKYSKETIKAKKKSLVNEARTGKLNVNGAFTFIIPDLYSFCEYLFKGEIKALLSEDEVYCKMHDEGRVAILRAPHLSREWGLKNNVDRSEHFKTDALYVSNESLLSKLIQCDWDGDRVLVLSEHKDKTLLDVAERNMQNDNILPLYYEMEKAKAVSIDDNNIYYSLKAAFDTNGAIGEVSNNITRVWNSEKVDLDVIRWMCMEVNFEIDFAKTLFRLTRPEHIDQKVKEYVNMKLPYFFKYDKRKNKKKGKLVKRASTEEKNTSTVNRLEDVIPTKNIYFRQVAGGKFDYKMLMRRKKVKLDDAIINKYDSLNKEKKDFIKVEDNKKKGKQYFYKHVKTELLKINPNPTYITDVLIEYLYGVEDSTYKDTLWGSFGEIIEYNLVNNLEEACECQICQSKFRQQRKTQVTCSESCQKIRESKQATIRKRKQRNKDIA
ncbi:hypothetical protein [Mesobacillus foraminis]|uniref:Uncharacterized protein n=1 Tax=Mesobacillus foraminis TaxID=279826 RepID=A0A4R2BG65_9BACI|nr:hypothetical protein [Mesobacillus foraminis]TCN25503.1 hypothetical protein EV146_105160 [Mesobacillus foraminis]